MSSLLIFYSVYYIILDALSFITMDTPLISVIVPVYNAEKYVSQCIDSIINQSYKNWELILIDDGSSDGSGLICESYAKTDQRIIVYHKQNGGVSSARNYGLDRARGTWITFIDADDWFSPGVFELGLCYTDFEVIRFPFNFVHSSDGSNTVPSFLDVSLTKDSYLELVVGRETLLGVCGGMYKNNLFYGKRFNESLSNGEDWLMLTVILQSALNVKILNRQLYNYNRYNENSCISTLNSKKVDDSLYALRIISESLINRSLSNSLARAKVELLYLRLRIASSTLIFANTPLSFKEIFKCRNLCHKKILVSFYLILYKLGLRF